MKGSRASDGPAAALYGSPAATSTLDPARRSDELIVIACKKLASSEKLCSV